MADELLATALEALKQALARSQGRRPLFLQLLYSDRTTDTVTIPEPGADAPPAGQASPGRGRTGSGGLRQLILRSLEEAGRPLKAAAIARRAGRTPSGHFRTTLKQMVEEGLLNQTAEGDYALPGWEAANG